MAGWNPKGKSSPLWYLVGLTSGLGNIITMIWVLVSDSKKKLFSLLYLINFLGPLIAYFVCKDEDPKLASISLKLAIGNILAGVIIGVIFAVGVFTLGTSHLGGFSSCIPAAGYTCSGASLNSGTFSAAVSQITGATWVQGNMFLVSSSSPAPTAVPSTLCEVSLPPGGLPSGQVFYISMNEYSSSNTCLGLPKTRGQYFAGSLWAAYKTSVNGTLQFADMGVVNLQAS